MHFQKQFTELPQSFRLALKIVSKFGFLNKQLFLKEIARSSRSQRFKEWNRLIQSGLFKQYDQTGVSKNYYQLSRRGKTYLDANGFKPVTKQHPIYFEHDELLMTFVVHNVLQNRIKYNWVTEKELRELLTSQQLDVLGYICEKKSDLVFNLEFGSKNIHCVFEIERTPKSKSRYDDFVLKYLKNIKIDIIFISFKDQYTKTSIQNSIKKYSKIYPVKAFAFCEICDLRNNPLTFEISVNENKIAFDQYLNKLSMLFKQQQKRENDTRLDFAEKSPKIDEAA